MTQRNKSGRLDGLWNTFSILGILGILGVLGMVFMIFTNPAASYNPFPPPTMPVPILLPTETATPFRLPATWTPTGEAASIANETATPTAILATQLPDGGVSLETQESKSTIPAAASYQFALQSAPASIEASILKPDLQGDACAWMGVGGQVLDIQGSPYTGVAIQLGGQQNGRTILLTSLTGTALQYGPAGYEFKISDAPDATVDNYWLRLVDQANLPLSDRIYFDTYDACEKNLIIINLKQVRQ